MRAVYMATSHVSCISVEGEFLAWAQCVERYDNTHMQVPCALIMLGSGKVERCALQRDGWEIRLHLDDSWEIKPHLEKSC